MLRDSIRKTGPPDSERDDEKAGGFARQRIGCGLVGAIRIGLDRGFATARDVRLASRLRGALRLLSGDKLMT